jgi:type IX secretion system PorP/SprF family membrane protein
MKKFAIIFTGVLLATAGSTTLRAQQDPMYTHYMYNTLSINPAYAGSRDALSILALGRFQWVGLDGAPMTQTFQVHSPIIGGLAGGISLVNDKIGPTNSTQLYVDLAYHFNLGKNHRLGIGIKAGVDFFNNNLSTLITDQPNDPSFAQNISRTLPNAGIGIYYHHTNAYFGFSIPRLIEQSISDNAADQKRHYFLIAGGYIPCTRNFGLKPTALVKIVEGAPVQGDFTLEAMFMKKFSVGAMYRSLDGVGALLGWNIRPNFRIGYSFDWPLTELSRSGQYGSHEIMLRYDLKFGRLAKIVSPRYF